MFCNLGFSCSKSAVNILFLASNENVIKKNNAFIPFQVCMLALQLPLHSLKIQLRKKKERKEKPSIKHNFIKD